LLLLGGLVVRVGELAEAVLEVQIAEVFVNRGLALIQVVERRHGLRFGQVLGRTPTMNASTAIARRQVRAIITFPSSLARSFDLAAYFSSAGRRLHRAEFGQRLGLRYLRMNNQITPAPP
jgi:hypothetical protein